MEEIWKTLPNDLIRHILSFLGASDNNVRIAFGLKAIVKPISGDVPRKMHYGHTTLSSILPYMIMNFSSLHFEQKDFDSKITMRPVKQSDLS
jgi:hypothetical protein